MKKIVLLLIVGLFVVFGTKAQVVAKDSVTVAKIKVPAQFPKGEKGWDRFLNKKLDDFTTEPSYPQGDFTLTVWLTFAIDITGEVIDVKVEKSCKNKKIDGYAIRALQASPKWIPATENGNPVKYRMRQSLRFEGREM